MTQVTDFGVLSDLTLIPELQNRINGKSEFLKFADEGTRGDLKNVDKDNLEKQVESKIKPLWKSLLTDAITFLKINDPREWKKKDIGKRGSKPKIRSVQAFGVAELGDYFDQFSEFEKVLYGAETYYRGHVTHVFRVWVLGALLLDDILPTSARPLIEFREYLEKELGKAPNSIPKERIDKARRILRECFSDDIIQAIWCVIALTHDLGYPLQKMDTINEQTRKMLQTYGKVNLQDINFDVPQEYHFINDFILRFISSRVMWKGTAEQLVKHLLEGKASKPPESSSFRTHIQSKYYLKFSKSLMDYEHGIISAILLMKNLVYFLESDFDLDAVEVVSYEDARQSSIRREILRAIASHTCDEIYHIRPNSLSFLLIICDELQCWGRPTFEEMQYALQGGEAAELRKFTENEVEYVLKLNGNEKDLKERTQKMFRHLNKLFRTALGAPDRRFKFMVTVEATDHKAIYTFRFDNNKFYWHKNGKGWDIWEEKSKTP